MKAIHVSAALALAFLSTPVHATEWLECDGGDAHVALLLGATDFLSISAVRLRAGEAYWVSDPVYGEGAIVTVGQGFEDEQMLVVDLFDEAVADRVAELRLFKAEEGDQRVYGGTIRVNGEGAWAMSCQSP